MHEPNGALQSKPTHDNAVGQHFRLSPQLPVYLHLTSGNRIEQPSTQHNATVSPCGRCFVSRKRHLHFALYSNAADQKWNSFSLDSNAIHWLPFTLSASQRLKPIPTQQNWTSTRADTFLVIFGLSVSFPTDTQTARCGQFLFFFFSNKFFKKIMDASSNLWPFWGFVAGWVEECLEFCWHPDFIFDFNSLN